MPKLHKYEVPVVRIVVGKITVAASTPELAVERVDAMTVEVMEKEFVGDETVDIHTNVYAPDDVKEIQ